MAEHTPTPWAIEEGSHWLSIGRPDAPIEHGQRQSIVATRWSGQVTDEERANAAFIVEAVNSHHALWDRIRKVEHDNNQAAARISHLESDLFECREYLKTEMDVVDGDYGEPAPNRAMQLVTMIDQTLNGPGV